MNSKSNYFRKSFKGFTDNTPIKTSATRWYGDIDATANLKEPLGNGSLVLVLEEMVARELCDKSAGKDLCVLRDVRKLTAIKVEVAVVGFIGLAIKVTGRLPEGDKYEQVTGYIEILKLEVILKHPVTPALLAELVVIAAAAPQAAAAPAAAEATPPAASARPGRSAALANANCSSQTHVPALSPATPPPVTYKNITEDGDLSDVEVLKKLVEVITKTAFAYMHKTVFGACSDQVARMKAATTPSSAASTTSPATMCPRVPVLLGC